MVNLIRRAKISLKQEVALTAKRILVGGKKLVYVLVADKAIPYQFGRSRILYIGTTKTGSSRIAQSVASRADFILQKHGIKCFHARVVTCSPRRRVKTWIKLERAFLLTFRELYGELPSCNTRGRNMRAEDEQRYFRRERLVAIIEKLSNHPN